MKAQIKGERFQRATEFTLGILELAQTAEETLNTWFAGISEGGVRSRLHGWALWAEFCQRQGVTPMGIKTCCNPIQLVAQFVCDMYLEGASESWRREAMAALYELLGSLRWEVNFKENPFLKSVIRGCTTAVKRQSKYREIWDLGILLDYLRKEGDPEDLTWSDLMRRTAAVFMIFVPLRPAAMLRLDPTTERTSKISKSIEIQTCDKTDARRARTYVAIRPLKDRRLCPLTHYRLLVKGAKERGLKDSLWCNQRGKAFVRSDPILYRLTKLLRLAGIPEGYTGYSIRHATITALFRFMGEKEVNAFTGHSQDAHVALEHYYHLDRNWAGGELAKLQTMVTVTPTMQKEFDKDESEAEQEQGKEPQDDEE